MQMVAYLFGEYQMKTNYYFSIFLISLLVLSGCSGSNNSDAEQKKSSAPEPETEGFIEIVSVADETLSAGKKGIVRTSIVSDENQRVLYFQWLDRNEQLVDEFTPASGVMYPNGKKTDFVFEYIAQDSGVIEYKLKITNEAKQEVLSDMNIRVVDQ